MEINFLGLRCQVEYHYYHSAAMLSLGGIKSFVFARQASARREFSAKLAVFIAPETQHGRRVIKVYERLTVCVGAL